VAPIAALHARVQVLRENGEELVAADDV